MALHLPQDLTNVLQDVLHIVVRAMLYEVAGRFIPFFSAERSE